MMHRREVLLAGAALGLVPGWASAQNLKTLKLFVPAAPGGGWDQTARTMEQALKDAGLKPTEVDEVLLVGGSTRMPKIQEIVKKFFGKEPNKGVNPDEVVAIGAAVVLIVIGERVGDVQRRRSR